MVKSLCRDAWSKSKQHNYIKKTFVTYFDIHVFFMAVCLEKRYRDSWDLATLTRKVNQKCRDTKMKGEPEEDRYTHWQIILLQ